MRRTGLLIAAFFFLGFAVYGSLVPLQIRHVPVSAALKAFLESPFLAHVSGTDFVTNVLLFMPIGFFFLGAAAPRGGIATAIWLVPVILICVSASIAIEFSQSFVVGRTASWDDVFAESLGGVAGAMIWIAVGSISVDWFSAMFDSQSSRERLFRMLGAYVILWGILSMLPFDFTVRPEELAEKFRAGRIVPMPFADGGGIEKFVSSFFFALPIGVFAQVLADTRRLRPTRTWALAIGIAAVLFREFGQFLSFSRTADSTDLLAGTAGVLAGIALAVRTDQSGFGRVEPGRHVRLWPVAVCAGWILVIMARHWSPFDFRADGAFIRSRIPMFLQVPFASYYWGSPLNAFSEVVTKTLLGVPVGGLLQAIYFPRTRAGRLWQSLAILIVAFAFFLTIELGQLLLPSRYPDQTDVYIGTLGAGLGLIGVRLLIRRSTTNDNS